MTDDKTLTELPRAPSWLGTHGKKYYKDVGRLLIDCQVLTHSSMASFEALCSCWQTYREAVAWLSKKENTCASVEGRSWATQRKQAFDQFAKFAIEFGLTPKSLAQMGKHGSVIGVYDTNPVLARRGSISRANALN